MGGRERGADHRAADRDGGRVPLASDQQAPPPHSQTRAQTRDIGKLGS